MSSSGPRMRKSRPGVNTGTSGGNNYSRARDNKSSSSSSGHFARSDGGSPTVAVVGAGDSVSQTAGSSSVPVEATGVFSDAKYVHMLSSLIGCNVMLLTTAGKLFDGILEGVSEKNEFRLRLVAPIDPDNPKKIDPDQVRERLVFECHQIVRLCVSSVDLEFASRSCSSTSANFQTDSSISERSNGAGSHRQLQPWVGDDNGPSTPLFTLNSANGWDPDEMFRTNERKYGVRSSFDQSLAGYTTELRKGSAKLEQEAARIASEIEDNPASLQRTQLSNGVDNECAGDEEIAFSAVVRPKHQQQPESAVTSSGDLVRTERYVPPAKRSGGPVNAGGGGNRQQHRSGGGVSSGGNSVAGGRNRGPSGHHRAQPARGRYTDHPPPTVTPPHQPPPSQPPPPMSSHHAKYDVHSPSASAYYRHHEVSGDMSNTVSSKPAEAIASHHKKRSVSPSGGGSGPYLRSGESARAKCSEPPPSHSKHIDHHGPNRHMETSSHHHHAHHQHIQHHSPQHHHHHHHSAHHLHHQQQHQHMSRSQTLPSVSDEVVTERSRTRPPSTSSTLNRHAKSATPVSSAKGTPNPPPNLNAVTAELKDFREKFVLADESQSVSNSGADNPSGQAEEVDGSAQKSSHGVAITASSSDAPVQSSVAVNSEDCQTSAVITPASTSLSTTSAQSCVSTESSTSTSTTTSTTTVIPPFKSKLNPNAKVFTLNPNAKVFTPSSAMSSASSVSSAQTPPRVTPPSHSGPYPPLLPAAVPHLAVHPHQQPSPQPLPAGISYIVTPQQLAVLSQQQQQSAVAAIRYQKQQQPRVGDYGAPTTMMIGPRAETSSAMQVAAVTGTPLLAGHPQAQIHLPHDFQTPAGGQLIMRMMPAASAAGIYQHPSQIAASPTGPYEPGQPPSAPPPQPQAPPPQAIYGFPGPAASAPGLPSGVYQYPPSSVYLLPSGQQLQPPFFTASGGAAGPLPSPAGQLQPVTVGPQPSFYLAPPVQPHPHSQQAQQPPPPPQQQQPPPPQPPPQHPGYPHVPVGAHPVHIVHHGVQ